MTQMAADLREGFQDLQKMDTHYQEMRLEREKLPVFAMKQQVLDIIYNNPVVLIKGHTGCGKTTQVHSTLSVF